MPYLHMSSRCHRLASTFLVGAANTMSTKFHNGPWSSFITQGWSIVTNRFFCEPSLTPIYPLVGMHQSMCALHFLKLTVLFSCINQSMDYLTMTPWFLAIHYCSSNEHHLTSFTSHGPSSHNLSQTNMCSSLTNSSLC